jgi:hypothetical protein
LSESIEQSEKPLIIVPDREVFEITRMGLPLDLKDNLINAMVIALAIALQIRLSHTFLAEGLIAFAGFIGYVAMRYWLLTRRYPEPGDLVIEKGMIDIPASVNGGQPVSFDLSSCSVKFFVNKGKSGDSATSVVFWQGLQTVRINSLSLDLSKLEKALTTRGVFIHKEYWQVGLYVVAVMLVAILIFFVFMAFR